MIDAIGLLVGAILRFFRSRRRLLLENLALRQQLAALKRRNTRPRLGLLSDNIRYYHEDRTHLGLNKETPVGRVRSVNQRAVVSRARLGGLHHRYDQAA
jgi:hypothetical protein